MLSSISNSEPQAKSQGTRIRIDRFTVCLLVLVVVFLLSLEAVCRVGFDRTSRVQQREVSQRTAALQVRNPGGNVKNVVMVGNSLMVEGVNLPLLTERIDHSYAVVPYFVLGTNYYDWYFGLKRMFAEGMRPDYVVIGLSPNQLAADSIRGDISSRYLFQSSDLLNIAGKTHMNATATSGLILAHYSEFYGTRDVIRGFAMSRVLPPVGEWLHTGFAAVRDPEVKEEMLKPIAMERLKNLNQLCIEHGAQFVLVIPPTYQKGAGTIERAGAEKGIKVLIPVGDHEFDASDYQSDGFHLNAEGAQKFTDRLAAELNQRLPVEHLATLGTR